jgi:hypothetical protein
LGASTVLQECGLLPDWVKREFAAPFLAECKQIANGEKGKRNPNQYLFIPAGDVHSTALDPPPRVELLTHMKVEYQQGDRDSCLRCSLASALAAMGFAMEAQVLANQEALSGCNVELVQSTARAVRTIFASSNVMLNKLHNHACSVASIAAEDAAWPIVLILQTSDGCYGTHAITTWNSMIFDSNSEHALRWSQSSLDWCSGEGSLCIGFSRAYRICPANYGHSLPQSVLSVGCQVRSQCVDSDALGWIMRLPSKKKPNGYHVRFTDGVTDKMSEGDAVELVIPPSRVCGD